MYKTLNYKEYIELLIQRERNKSYCNERNLQKQNILLLKLESNKSSCKKKITNSDFKYNNNERICEICFENISDFNLIKTECNHFFHDFCYSKWIFTCILDKKVAICPSCRRNNPNVLCNSQR